MKFTRITVDPQQIGGVPCIRGLRVPVATVVGMVADGRAETEILAAYPDLQHEDIAEALHYAAKEQGVSRSATDHSVRFRQFLARPVSSNAAFCGHCERSEAISAC